MNDITPLVSVIIPNYNHARFLGDRIQSVLNQTYRNFEIIILDDCSTDDSLIVLQKYKNNPHVSKILVNETNSGSTFSQWQMGFKMAKGELVWIAESDDMCSNSFLEKIIREFSKDHELVLAFVTSLIIDEDNRPHNIIQPKRHQKYIHQTGIKFIRNYLYRYNIIYNASSAVFRKSVVDNISDEFSSYKASGDWLFWIEICEKGNVAMINEPLNFYRKHFSNVTTKYERNGLQQVENNKILDYLSNHKLINNRLKKEAELLNYYHLKYHVEFLDEEIRNSVLEECGLSPFLKILIYPLHIIYIIRNKFLGNK